MPKNPLIPTAEVAQILGVDVRTVHRMADDRRLTPSMKIPGRTGAYLFDRADVERLAADRRSDAETAA